MAGQVVQPGAEIVSLVTIFFTPQVGQLNAHVPEEGERIDIGIGGGIHHIDNASALHGITHAAHRALNARHVIVEHAIAHLGVRGCHDLCLCHAIAHDHGEQ